jgi:hypothetical protein
MYASFLLHSSSFVYCCYLPRQLALYYYTLLSTPPDDDDAHERLSTRTIII